ncbi:serine hydrolase domain-containing protein [Desulfofustis limnaeus]|jgi:CubicO group peptidase (beta-lactamase class C family)|uniref:Beta-lactamase-related domain-containing protein n=1 Tax=Desulfofustis limnaeus TaxID=2740163 RepID=A0ABM7WDH5_9BACT|nr:serine hydrolase [Desulfofustis limnaeus]MDX9894181.1 serine hydrolase [Desulfofustis sp.]BDD89051.1 hypothetical protein DPPLL_34160 [Desulfofustis limnaeus]
MMSNLLFSLLLLLVSFFSVSCRPDYFPSPESEGGWRKNTDPKFIRSLHLDPDRLGELGSYGLSVPSSELSSVLVIKDGWLVGEWYSAPEARHTPIYTASVGKTFALICFGIAEKDSQEGRLPYRIDNSSHVYDRRWLPQGYPLSDPGKRQITFDHIFQHTSGLVPQASTVEQDLPIEQGRNQWRNYLSWVVGHSSLWPQTKELYFPPGSPEEFASHACWGSHCGAYSSVGFAHIGLVLANLYQMPAHRFLRSRLLDPIGFSAVAFEEPPAPPEILWFSGGGLRMLPRDFARFAYLLLHEGRWGKQQLVRPEWFRSLASSPRYENLRTNHDGYFGTAYPPDLIRVYGSGGNFAFIFPSQQLIVLKTGRIHNFFLDLHMRDFLHRASLIFTDVSS